MAADPSDASLKRAYDALLAARPTAVNLRWALDDLRARKFWRREFTVALVVLCALDGLAYDWVRFAKTFTVTWKMAPEGTAFYQIMGNWREMMSNVFENRGAIGCDEEAPLQRALRLDEGPRPQARVEDPSTGRIAATRWTPNRVELDVELSAPAVVSVNENWNEHWRVELIGDARDAERAEVVRVGPKLERDKDGGRLGARVPRGRYTVAFVYRPRSFVVGLVISALAIPLLIGAWIFARRRRRRR